MPILLKSGDTIFDTIKVTDEKVAWAGQAICHRGINTQEKISEPWKYNVFIKQFEDVVPESKDMENAIARTKEICERLHDRFNQFCIPTYFGYDERSSSFVAVYPNIDRETLKAAMTRPDGIAEQACAEIVWKVAECVWELHQRNIAHRDLNPANIMIIEKRSDPSRIYSRLVDFDAAAIDGKGVRPGTLGTPDWHSPEHSRKELSPPSYPSDIFCLGLIAFNLLVGRPPFGYDLPFQEAILSADIVVPEIDYDFEAMDCVLRMLAPCQVDRPEINDVVASLLRSRKQGFKALDHRRRWRRPEYYKLSSGDGFEHYYSDSKSLTPSSLRGSGLKTTSFNVSLGPITTIFALPSSGPLVLNGIPVDKERPPRLVRRGNNVLEAEGVKLRLEVSSI